MMSLTRFRVNPHSEVQITATGLEPTTTKFINEHSTIQPNQPNDFAPALNKEFLEIQATIECGFTLKRGPDIIRTYSQMHRTNKYSQYSLIIWPVWLNG